MYTLRYLKISNKTTKYTDSDEYKVKKRNLFLSQKKKFARKLERFALGHLKRKNIWLWKKFHPARSGRNENVKNTSLDHLFQRQSHD